MPPEPLPWDRKERKHERSSEPLGPVSRWRDSPHHHGSSFWSRDFARSRPPGHSRQGGWHLYSEESGHGLTPFRFNEKILDDENCRPSGTRADGKYSRNSRDNRGLSSQKDWKGHSWENGASPHGPGRPVDVSDQKSVDNMLTYKSHPPDFKNTWDHIHLKEQHDMTSSVNGLTTGQRFERENSLGPIDWKPLKWTRSGSLSSRGSGFSHSSSSKSMGVDSAETKSEVQPRNATPAESPSADALVCTASAAPSEETNSRKKPRLNWGEGLAKYEKKKVEGPDDGVTKQGIVVCASFEHLPSPAANLADKSPRIAGFSDCASPATPSSVACSSSPGLEEKPFVKTVNIDNDAGNLSGSPLVLSQDHLEGREFNLDNLEIAPITNLISSVSELLQSDNPVLVDSSFVRSSAINKLLSWKGSILKGLETTESEIDSLENELKLLISDFGNSPCPAASSSLQDKCEEKSCEVVTSNLIGRPATLELPSSEDMIAEKGVGGLVEEHAQSRDEYVDSPGTVTSKFVEPFSSVKDSTLSDPIKHGESTVDLDSSKCRNLEVECAVYPSNKEKTGLSVGDGDGQLIASKSYPGSPDRNDISSDLILSSNKDSANQASEVFNKVLPSENRHIDTFRTNNGPIDPLVKEKFAMRKHFLTFKERVIAVKFRAFQQLWKEDMRLLSIRKNRAKSYRRLELSSRITHGNYQKHRSSIRSRLSAPAPNQSLVPNTVILNSLSKLLSDSPFKLYRNSLKMPALILDKKEKTNSMFISSNGLVQDPCASEKERAMFNPWTTEEKQIFMDNLATFGKDFGKIALFLDHKTTADCIEFYYKNHKSDSFVKIKKKPQFANNYLVTSGKRWNPEINAASLDMLGAASAIASNADGMENQQKCTARFLLRVPSDHNGPQGDVGFKEAGSPHSFCNERETEAADVLAGICGSLSSEAMSSCITSSFDLGESYPDWKCQWLCSSIRRPLTPEVTQNVDDETCSDESCGEMDYADWKDEEKSIFIQAVSSYGTDFAMISRCVRTKSKDQCKVFFSKARKCLGLDMICPRPDDGAPISDDANGGGTDNEDACVVEAGSVFCSEKSGSKMDEDMLLSDFNLKHCESDPMVTMSLQTDLNIEDNNGAGKIDCKDHERQLVPMPTHNLQAEGKLEIDVTGESKMENGVDGSPLMAQPQKDAHLIPDDIEAEVDEAAGEGNSMVEPMAVEEFNDQRLPVSGAGDELTGVASDSTVLLKSEQEGLMVSENNLNVKQDENGVANTGDLNCLNKDMHSNANASDLAANTNAPMDFNICPKQEHGHKIILDLNPPRKPHAISVEQDVLLVNAKCMNEDSSASQYTIRQDPPLVLDFRNIGEWQLKKSTSLDNDSQLQPGSVLGHVESRQILSGYPVPVMAKKEMNGDIGSLKLASSQSLSKVKGDFDAGIYLSQECFLQKCNSSKAQTSVVELPFLPHEQKNTHSRHHSWSSSDSEKPFRNGDVKLFGKILTHQSSQQKQNTSCIHENEDKGVEHSKCLKYNGTNSVDTNSVPAKFDSNNYLGLEKAPVRSYGFWDGNRIQTGFPTLPDSAVFLAKYPAAFGNYSTSSKMEQQQPLQSVGKSNERNLNGLSVFPCGDMTNSNGVADYHLYRNREGNRVQPFTVDIKQQQQRQDMFCDTQNRNGFESMPSLQQQARGVVGINVVGRGILGEACTTGVSDPVAALKMHYAKTEQYGGGGGGSISIEEGSWRGKGGDVGR